MVSWATDRPGALWIYNNLADRVHTKARTQKRSDVDVDILITGAAKGIGRACALRLARAGHHVFAGVRDPAAGEMLQREAAGITPIQLEVTDARQIAEAAAQIQEHTGTRGLYGLVNNAGIAVAGPLEFLPVEELRRQLEVNVVAQIAVTQAMLPLIRRAGGRIVNIGSIAGKSALPMVGPYAASKFALEALTDSLRVELMSSGIQVAIVEPGVIATPIWETSAATADRIMEGMPAQAFEYYGKIIKGLKARVADAAKRGLPPEQVAAAVEHALFAARPKTRYLVGRDAKLRTMLQRLPDRVRDRLIHRQLSRM
jgi:NAD(P)-dependent dehydrogenase (short-subunit alcohol dehydrogenase family)